MNVKDEMINTANFAKQATREDQEGTAPTLSRVASTAEFKTLDGSRQADQGRPIEGDQTIQITIGGD